MAYAIYGYRYVDAWQFIEKYMPEVLPFALDSKVHLVLRPDSGNILE